MTSQQFSLSLPLRIELDRSGKWAAIKEANDRLVCSVHSYDAPQLVHSVNCHAELLAACKDFRHEWEEFLSGDYAETPLAAIADRMRQAITHAEREEQKV